MGESHTTCIETLNRSIAVVTTPPPPPPPPPSSVSCGAGLFSEGGRKRRYVTGGTEVLEWVPDLSAVAFALSPLYFRLVFYCLVVFFSTFCFVLFTPRRPPPPPPPPPPVCLPPPPPPLSLSVSRKRCGLKEIILVA